MFVAGGLATSNVGGFAPAGFPGNPLTMSSGLASSAVDNNPHLAQFSSSHAGAMMTMMPNVNPLQSNSLCVQPLPTATSVMLPLGKLMLCWERSPSLF